MEEIRQKLLNYFKHELTDDMLKMSLTCDSDLLESRIIDSLNMMKNILYIEKEFELSMYDMDFDLTHFTNINSITELIYNHKHLKSQ